MHFQHPHQFRYFYPRPPRGGRRVLYRRFLQSSGQFLSTPSARRATLPTCEDDFMEFISIHALREEGD